MQTKTTVIVVAALLLAACGGGGSGVTSGRGGEDVPVVPWTLDPATARAVTGGAPPPALTSSAIGRRLRTIHAQADTLLLTDLHNLSFAIIGDISTNCRGGSCATADGLYSLSDFDFSTGQYQAVMTGNGVALAQGRETEIVEDGFIDSVGYGGWMDRSFFAVEAAAFYEGSRAEGWSEAFVTAYSVGNDSGSRPVSGAATWTGAMSGADLEFQHLVQGDAAVTVNFARSDAAVAFTNVRDIIANAALPAMRWSGLAIGSDGRFGARDLRATFYGPNHEEVGGVFERSEIVGAFGASR